VLPHQPMPPTTAPFSSSLREEVPPWQTHQHKPAMHTHSTRRTRFSRLDPSVTHTRLLHIRSTSQPATLTGSCPHLHSHALTHSHSNSVSQRPSQGLSCPLIHTPSSLNIQTLLISHSPSNSLTLTPVHSFHIHTHTCSLFDTHTHTCSLFHTHTHTCSLFHTHSHTCSLFHTHTDRFSLTHHANFGGMHQQQQNQQSAAACPNGGAPSAPSPPDTKQNRSCNSQSPADETARHQALAVAHWL